MKEKLIKLIVGARGKCHGRVCDICEYKDAAGCFEHLLVDRLIANGVVIRSAKPMRVEVTTDDFRDLESARANGCYRKHFFCPSCGIEIGHQTFDSKRKFGQGTVLHSNWFPNCCPGCGEGLRMEDNDEQKACK